MALKNACKDGAQKKKRKGKRVDMYNPLPQGGG
jgi:hypothetical protein